MRWYFTALNKYAVFHGRARRREYWMFVLWNAIFGFLLSVLDVMLGTWNMEADRGVISTLYSLAVLVPGIAVTVRRLHDIGKSGWKLLWIPAVFLLATALPDDIHSIPEPSSEWMGFTTLTMILFSVTLIVAVPIWILILLMQDSQPGANRYGPNPKAIQTS